MFDPVNVFMYFWVSKDYDMGVKIIETFSDIGYLMWNECAFHRSTAEIHETDPVAHGCVSEYSESPPPDIQAEIS